MKKGHYFFILIVELLIFIFLQKNLIHIPCVFKTISHIPCPGCGLTRAMREVLQFHFSKAVYYNILIIPIILFFDILNVLIFLDIIQNRNYVSAFIKRIFCQWKILLFLLIFSEILNIYHHI